MCGARKEIAHWGFSDLHGAVRRAFLDIKRYVYQYVISYFEENRLMRLA
jgi:hypothetical protein